MTIVVSNGLSSQRSVVLGYPAHIYSHKTPDAPNNASSALRDFLPRIVDIRCCDNTARFHMRTEDLYKFTYLYSLHRRVQWPQSSAAEVLYLC